MISQGLMKILKDWLMDFSRIDETQSRNEPSYRYRTRHMPASEKSFSIACLITSSSLCLSLCFMSCDGTPVPGQNLGTLSFGHSVGLPFSDVWNRQQRQYTKNAQQCGMRKSDTMSFLLCHWDPLCPWSKKWCGRTHEIHHRGTSTRKSNQKNTNITSQIRHHTLHHHHHSSLNIMSIFSHTMWLWQGTSLAYYEIHWRNRCKHKGQDV